jgi:hypothetical protein
MVDPSLWILLNDCAEVQILRREMERLGAKGFEKCDDYASDFQSPLLAESSTNNSNTAPLRCENQVFEANVDTFDL